MIFQILRCSWIIYLNFVDQTLTQKLSHKNTCPKMSQIFNSSPRFFPREDCVSKKQEADDQIHNGHALWRSTFSNTFGRSDMEKLTIFLIQKLLCIKKNPYTKKKQKEQKTRNASYTTTTIQNKNCLRRMYPATAYIVCFKAHEGLKSKFVLTTVIEFKIYVVHKSCVIHMQKSTLEKC